MLNIPEWQEERISATWIQGPHGEGSSLFCASSFISLVLPYGEQAVLCASFPSLISSIWHYHICYISSSQCWHERTSPRVVNRIKSRKLAKPQNVILHDSFQSEHQLCCALEQWGQQRWPHSSLFCEYLLIQRMQTPIIHISTAGNNEWPD